MRVFFLVIEEFGVQFTAYCVSWITDDGEESPPSNDLHLKLEVLLNGARKEIHLQTDKSQTEIRNAVESHLRMLPHRISGSAWEPLSCTLKRLHEFLAQPVLGAVDQLNLAISLATAFSAMNTLRASDDFLDGKLKENAQAVRRHIDKSLTDAKKCNVALKSIIHDTKKFVSKALSNADSPKKKTSQETIELEAAAQRAWEFLATMYSETGSMVETQLEEKSKAKADEWQKWARGDVAFENTSWLGELSVEDATLADLKSAYEATLRKVKPADLAAALKECNAWRIITTDLEKILGWHINLCPIVEVQKILQARNVTI